MVRNESRVVIKGHISLPPETVENGQQTSMFFVDTRPNEINDRDYDAPVGFSHESYG
jgi:hypothetical protein